MPRLYQAAASPLFWHLRLHSFVVQMRRHALEQLVELRSTLPGFTHDHSHADLVGRVVAVSVETVRIVDGLAGLSLAKG